MTVDQEIHLLAQIEGPLYLSLRDALLNRGVGKADLMARFRGDPDWRVATVGSILQGWTEKNSLYRSVLAQVDDIDPAARGRAATGIVGIWEEFEMRAHGEYGPAILPLAWENVIKLAGGVPAWRTATFLAMISGAPRQESVEPVAHVIETTDDKMVRERAAYAMAKLPREAVDDRLARLNSKAAGVIAAVQSARELRK